jgi:uncharacterized protein (DUF1501 family)
MMYSRRRFLGQTTMAAAAAALPSWTPRLAFRKAGVAPRGDILVCIFQRGGMDGLSAVVPYQEQRYYDTRPSIAFKGPTPGDPKAVLKLDDQFGLNPAFTGLKRIWDDGRLAIVHAVGSPDESRSHFDAMDYMERGSPGRKSLGSGWIGRHLSETAMANDSPFRAIGMGSLLQQSLRGEAPVASMQSIADFHLQGREGDLAAFRQSLEALYGGGDWFDEDARATFAALDLLERANPQQYRPENGAEYPQTGFGIGLSQIAQLIKADVGLEVACVDMGGWDTHTNQVWNAGDTTRGQMFNLLDQFSDAITAFYTDLGQRFVDPGITLVTMSEFGRRVAQNAANGTDHGHGNCMFIVSGAAVQGVHVDWPGLDTQYLSGGEDVPVTTDYRDVLGEILVRRLGDPYIDRVFPDYAPSFRGVVTPRADARPAMRRQLHLPMVERG